LVLLVTTSCDRRPEVEVGVETPRRDGVVARVGDAVITAQAFREELQRRGSGADKAQVLEDLIGFQAWLAKARAAGYDRDPELRLAWERAVVARFQEDAWKQWETGTGSVTEEEARVYYEAHLSQHTTPRRVRAGVVLLKSSARADAASRQAVEHGASMLREEAVRADAAGFAELVRQHSEDQATRYQGGDAGWLQVGAASGHWEPEVVAAAAALSRPGDVAPVVVTTRGFHVVRLMEHQAEAVVPFENVRDGVRHQVAREKRRRQQERFDQETRAGLRIEINQEVLNTIPAPVPSPQLQPPALPGG
jgi:hypothetical protein